MRLSIRKRKDVKKDLFDALLERNCMLRFTQYLQKRDDRCLARLNFWLEAQLYRECNGTSAAETNRICDEYLAHLDLSSFTQRLLEERMLMTPFIFLLAQSEAWDYLNTVVFPDFQIQKGCQNKISSAKLKHVCESQPNTVHLIDKYIRTRKSKDSAAISAADSQRMLIQPSKDTKESIREPLTTRKIELNDEVYEYYRYRDNKNMYYRLIPSHLRSLDESPKSSSSSKTHQISKPKYLTTSDVLSTGSGTSESPRTSSKSVRKNTVAEPTFGIKQSGDTPVSKNSSDTFPIRWSGSPEKQTTAKAKFESLPQDKSSEASEDGTIEDLAISVVMSTSSAGIVSLEKLGLAINLPDLAAGKLGKLNLPSFSMMWLDFGLYLAFKDYLSGVFSQDSLSFYVKAEHYRLVSEKKSRTTIMRAIYSHYIEKNIVHVTSRQSQKIRAQFSSAPSDLFQEVSRQIHDLLRYQWIDFVFSPQYQSLVAGTMKIQPILSTNSLSSTNCYLDLQEYFFGSPKKSTNPTKNPAHTTSLTNNANSKLLSATSRRASQTSVSSSAAFTSTISSTASSIASASAASQSKMAEIKEKSSTEGTDGGSAKRPIIEPGRRPHRQRNKRSTQTASGNSSAGSDSSKLHITIKHINMNPNKPTNATGNRHKYMKMAGSSPRRNLEDDANNLAPIIRIDYHLVESDNSLDLTNTTPTLVDVPATT